MSGNDAQVAFGWHSDDQSTTPLADGSSLKMEEGIRLINSSTFRVEQFDNGVDLSAQSFSGYVPSNTDDDLSELTNEGTDTSQGVYTLNDSSKNFMEMYIDQINNPTWNPYVQFRTFHPHNSDLKNLDWWVDQDFLCVCDRFKNEINEGSLGFDVKLYDAKSKI